MNDAETSQATGACTFGKVPAPEALGGYLARLTGADAKVLLALASHAGNASAIAYPSRATLAQMTGMPPRSIARSLRRLEALRAILHVSGGRGRGRTTCYRIGLTGEAEKGDAGDTYSTPKGDVGDTFAQPKADGGDTFSDQKGDAQDTVSEGKGDEARPKRCHPGHPKRKEESKETTPPLTPPATDLAESATDGVFSKRGGEGADFPQDKNNGDMVAAVGAAWREATGAGLSAADAETITAEAGNGSAELLGQITAESIIAADHWRREGTRKFNVLNLKVVLMYLREKALDRARAHASNAGGEPPACQQALDAAAARNAEAAAKAEHFHSLPADRREAYLAAARAANPTATSDAFIEGTAIAAAWAEYETSEDTVNVE